MFLTTSALFTADNEAVRYTSIPGPLYETILLMGLAVVSQLAEL